jgi:hypothetical protein
MYFCAKFALILMAGGNESGIQRSNENISLSSGRINKTDLAGMARLMTKLGEPFRIFL